MTQKLSMTLVAFMTLVLTSLSTSLYAEADAGAASSAASMVRNYQLQFVGLIYLELLQLVL